MTPRQAQQLTKALARALSWSAETEDARQRYMTRARALVCELDRQENVGNAIQLKHAIEDAVRRSA